jgi:DNA polymerase III subunit epsilon
VPAARDASRRSCDAWAYAAEFLADKPLFAAVADDFLAFVGDAQLVALNAGFDIGFLNAELKRACKPPIATERVIDTLVLARRKHAGNNTLDELCSRYGVDRSHRTQHGALLEAELLAAVYVELTTTRQAALALEPIARTPSNVQALVRARPRPLPPRVTAAYFFSHHAPRAVPSSPRPSITVQHHHDVAFHNRYVGIRSTGAPTNQHPTTLLKCLTTSEPPSFFDMDGVT